MCFYVYFQIVQCFSPRVISFSFHCFNGFSVASCVMVQDVRERPLTYNYFLVPYSAPTDCDRSVVLTLDDRPDPQLWGHCRSTHNFSMICFFVFAVVSLWHPGDGRDARKKPLPYNYFFTLLF